MVNASGRYTRRLLPNTGISIFCEASHLYLILSNPGKPYLIVNGSKYVKLEWNKELFVPLVPDMPYQITVLLPGWGIIPFQNRKATLIVNLRKGETRRYHYTSQRKRKEGKYIDDPFSKPRSVLTPEYPIPCCGNCKRPLRLRSGEQDWYCDYCGTYPKFDIPLKKLLAEMDRSDISFSTILIYAVVFMVFYILYSGLFDYLNNLYPDIIYYIGVVLILLSVLSFWLVKRPGKMWRTA
jgi:hypothetical protein